MRRFLLLSGILATVAALGAPAAHAQLATGQLQATVSASTPDPNSANNAGSTNGSITCPLVCPAGSTACNAISCGTAVCQDTPVTVSPGCCRCGAKCEHCQTQCGGNAWNCNNQYCPNTYCPNSHPNCGISNVTSPYTQAELATCPSGQTPEFQPGATQLCTMPSGRQGRCFKCIAAASSSAPAACPTGEFCNRRNVGGTCNAVNNCAAGETFVCGGGPGGVAQACGGGSCVGACCRCVRNDNASSAGQSSSAAGCRGVECALYGDSSCNAQGLACHQIDEGVCFECGGTCGNHLIDTGEQCDDGNTRDDDGCSATCTLENNFCGLQGGSSSARPASSARSSTNSGGSSVSGRGGNQFQACPGGEFCTKMLTGNGCFNVNDICMFPGGQAVQTGNTCGTSTCQGSCVSCGGGGGDPNRVVSCVDTDVNPQTHEYFTKGTATVTYGDGRTQAFVDKCKFEGNIYLEEYACFNGQLVSPPSYGHICPNGAVCRDGACIPGICHESDGGDDPAVRGTITIDSRQSRDDCINTGDHPNSQWEAVCAPQPNWLLNGTPIKLETWIPHRCPTGQKCDEGLCIPESEANPPAGVTCRKTYPANSTMDPGTTTRTGPGINESYVDKCASSTIEIDYDCALNGTVIEWRTTCPTYAPECIGGSCWNRAWGNRS